jgi:hypothetical protein
MKKLVGLMIVGFWLLAVAADVQAMWCGTNLVTVGDRKADVLFVCGEPLLAEVVGTEKTAGLKEILEEWIYHPGEGSFLYILTFRGGKLIRIETGDRR